MRRNLLRVVIASLMVLTMIPPVSFAAELPFTDVSGSDWYYSDLKGAYESGLINGFEDHTFRPESSMTYAQAVKLAACMNQKYTAGSVTLANGSPQWYDSYTAYAREQNIISRDYDWDAPATRDGYAEIFANALPDSALKEMNNIQDGSIPDVSMDHPQADAIYRLYRAGVLTGIDQHGTFASKNRIKRSEVSAILARMMDENARKELTLDPQLQDIIFYELKTPEYYPERPDTEQYCIPSVSELNTFCSIYSDVLKDRDVLNDSGEQNGKTALEDYLSSDCSVFIQVKEVGSGSVKMKLRSVLRENQRLSFVIDVAHPSLNQTYQTCDMAFWYFVAIVPDDQLDGLDLSDWKLPSVVRHLEVM